MVVLTVFHIAAAAALILTPPPNIVLTLFTSGNALIKGSVNRSFPSNTVPQKIANDLSSSSCQSFTFTLIKHWHKISILERVAVINMMDSTKNFPRQKILLKNFAFLSQHKIQDKILSLYMNRKARKRGNREGRNGTYEKNQQEQARHLPVIPVKKYVVLHSRMWQNH